MTHVHPKGWQLSAPESFTVRFSPMGFAIGEAGRRYPRTARIEARKGSPPGAAWHKRRTAAGVPARYRVSVEPQGNGEPLWTLEVWQPRPGGYLWYVWQEHQEPWLWPPSFADGWQVFASLRMK